MTIAGRAEARGAVKIRNTPSLNDPKPKPIDRSQKIEVDVNIIFMKG